MQDLQSSEYTDRIVFMSLHKKFRLYDTDKFQVMRRITLTAISILHLLCDHQYYRGRNNHVDPLSGRTLNQASGRNIFKTILI